MKYLGDNNLNLFFEFLKEKGHQIKSCTTDEIEGLIQLTKKGYLPKNYLVFMQYAGNGIRFFKGSSYNVKEVPKLKEWAIELLQDNNSEESITDNNFVFFMHQGYQFCFFNLDEGDNPPIYFYSEGENQDRFIKKSETLSGFLINYYNEVEALIKD